jgi:hypothetical protein
MNEPDTKVYRKVLLMVAELHVRGYQRMRIAPGMSASGCYWRCSIAPATNISKVHGALLVSDEGPVVHYSSADGGEYFGWQDASHFTPSRLAARFIKRFPAIASAGRGRDWAYVGWYQEMLHLTHPDRLPLAYADWDSSHPPGCIGTTSPTGAPGDVFIPMPPPGESDKAIVGV